MNSNTTSHMHRHYRLVEKALRYIHQHRYQQPSLAHIAEHCAISEFHLQRVFKEWAGVSPKQFLQSLTKQDCLQRLQQGETVLSASDASGLSTSSRLHDLFITLDAVTPGEVRARGNNITFYYAVHDSPFGQCFIAITERGIHRMEFVDEHNSIDSVIDLLKTQWPMAKFVKEEIQTADYIDRIFGESTNSSKVRLWIKGSAFQFKVWEALLRVPSGRLCSYSTLAKAIKQPRSARAVGTAVANNSVALLIPCHRVIKNIGVPGNYRWGETRKQALIGWEASENAEFI